MHFTFRNVNEAFHSMVTRIDSKLVTTVKRSSRYGDTLTIEEPVTITYTHPRERVLMNPARDCNPFFHLFESLWMLAGRNDVKPLAYYSSRMKEFSDDGVTFNGAYGYRWRYTQADKCEYAMPDEMYRDQLKILIEHLRSKPDSRRAVLQMWTVEDDLLKIDTSVDVCCNTNVYFSLRKERVIIPTYPDEIPPRFTDGKTYLDMTVCNRSNDMIWGMFGANVVHFSFLQEYVANCLGVGVGVYNQFTNNLHVYLKTWEPKKWLGDPGYGSMTQYYRSTRNAMSKTPLVKDQELFDREVKQFIEVDWTDPPMSTFPFTEPFLRDVAEPMGRAFYFHKHREYDNAHGWMMRVQAPDWRLAGSHWISKRQASWERKQNVSE